MCHIIAFLNSKGGSGKSTISIHTALFFAEIKYRVCAIDMDEKQCTLFTFFENRKNFIQKYNLQLAMVNCILSNHENLYETIHDIKQKYDIIVIDTPGFYVPEIFRNVISMSDIIVSPLNESFVDIHAIERSHLFYDMMNNKIRKNMGSHISNWLIVTNRRSCTDSDHYQMFLKKLNDIKKKYHCNIFEGFFENNIFKEMFSYGLSLLDHEKLKLTPSVTQQKGREIIKNYMLEIVKMLFKK